jgi:hypothetical protein
MMKHRASLKIYDGIVSSQHLDGVSGLERPDKDDKVAYDPAADRKTSLDRKIQF